MKYQFCIRFKNIDANSAASKAVLDCNKIFSDQGYRDYTFTVGDNSNKLGYYFSLLKELVVFFFAVKRGSVIGIQYPLLSINSIFKYFMRLAWLKKVKFFCIVHDLESLRNGGKNTADIQREIDNLSSYDIVIVHNEFMMEWLKQAGLKRDMISLNVFDYLCDDIKDGKTTTTGTGIAYAGNLSKSTFIYSLGQIKSQHFRVYGPNFKEDKILNAANITWGGEFSPQQIVNELSGSFGLIWDGEHINKCDEILGNYLKYNNPHKFSLYLAAGLPVIAPADAAIANFIKLHNIGILVNNLHELQQLQVTAYSYAVMKKNVSELKKKVSSGYYFKKAIKLTEEKLNVL